MEDKQPDNPKVFPLVADTESNYQCQRGLNLFDYYIAHAPETSQWEFSVPMETERPKPIYGTNDLPWEHTITNQNEIYKWDKEYKEKRSKMWASEWAHVQLKERTKHL